MAKGRIQEYGNSTLHRSGRGETRVGMVNRCTHYA